MPNTCTMPRIAIPRLHAIDLRSLQHRSEALESTRSCTSLPLSHAGQLLGSNPPSRHSSRCGSGSPAAAAAAALAVPVEPPSAAGSADAQGAITSLRRSTMSIQEAFTGKTVKSLLRDPQMFMAPAPAYSKNPRISKHVAEAT